MQLIQLQRRRKSPPQGRISPTPPRSPNASPQEAHWAWRYLISCLAVLLFLGINLLFPELGRPAPFLLYYPAIVLSGLIGGLGPGLLAVVLSAITIAHFNLPPLEKMRPFADSFRLAMFIALGIGISYLNHFTHSTIRRLRESDEALRESKDKLQASERRLRLFIEHAPVALAMFDHQMRYIAASRRWLSDFHLENASIIGLCHYEVFPELPERWKQAHRRGLAGEVLRSEEDLFQRADGSSQWLRWEIRPWSRGDGSVGGIIIYSEEITARKESQDQLRGVLDTLAAQRRLYDTILSNTPDLIFVFDLRHRFTYANDALLKTWGITEEEAIGKNFLELGYPDWQAAMHDREIEQVIATKTVLRGEVPFKGTQGLRIYDYIFVPVLNAKGEVEAIAGTTRDVTEFRHHASYLEGTVAQRTAELQQSIAELERFTYTVAHDLRAPLRAVHRSTEMLLAKNGGSRSEMRQYLDSIITGTRRMDRLIEDLLTYSRIGQAELHLEPVNVRELVANAIDSLAAEIHERQATVKADIDASLRALGDKFLLQQALSNILMNALKFIPLGRHPSVDIGAESKGGRLRLWIQDNGIGIEPQYRGRIFRIFERLHGRDEYPGTGIGLAIVSRAIERLGGQVDFESTPGEGSRFWILIKEADPA